MKSEASGTCPGRDIMFWLHKLNPANRFKEYFEPRSLLIDKLWGGHICGTFNVSRDDAEVMASLARAGAEMIDAKPRKGKGGSTIAFVHPKSTGKILFELVENKKR